jgi:hypothetical protein
VRVVYIRHGIEAALGEWAAASEPFQGEQRAAASTMPRDGFVGVIRAGGIELACTSEERAKKNLVQPDEREQKP